MAALLGGCSRPHVLPFHSLSAGLTLPFDEGPNTSRVPVPEKWSRPPAAAMAWSHGGVGRCLSPATSPRLARSLPPWRRPRQTHSRANRSANADSSAHVKNKREDGGRLPIICRRAGSNTSEVPRGTPCQHRLCRRSNPTPAARTNPLWILLGLAFPLARTQAAYARARRPFQPNPTSLAVHGNWQTLSPCGHCSARRLSVVYWVCCAVEVAWSEGEIPNT